MKQSEETERTSYPDTALHAYIKAFVIDIGYPSAGIDVRPIPSDGSQRLFWRISPDQADVSFIAMENPPKDNIAEKENLAYLKIGTHLFDKGLPVPKIHCVDLHRGWFILDDFGDTNLQTAASTRDIRISLYADVVEILFRLQTIGRQGFDTAWCSQAKRYDQIVMRRYESDYFRDAFLHRYLGLKKDWPELNAPFDHLAETASKADTHFFLHRDFQSRNIMIFKKGIGIIDWQGGRLGPLAYDLASLLIDPYAQLSKEEEERVYQHYLLLLKEYQFRSLDSFKRSYPYLAIQRNLQILGAFSYLSKAQGKSFFETYIPPAIKTLRSLLDELKDPKLSSLKDVLNTLPSHYTHPQDS